MAKRRWFSLIKRFFVSETTQNRTKEKKRRWVFGKPKLKRITSQSAIIERPESLEKNVHVAKEVDDHKMVSHSINCDKKKENNAVVKIQTAFRGLLARKALRALKGLVRLQAIIRGHLVRRQAVTTLKRLQSVVNIQSQACAKRVQLADCTSHNNNHQEYRGKDIKIDINSEKRWDDSILTKEEENAMLFSKREAAMKRERIKEYTYNHRMSSESEQSKVNGKWRYWLEHWVDTQLAKREDLQNIVNKHEFESQKVKLRNLRVPNPATHNPKPTHHRKQRSIGEDPSMGSPVFPTYMAATQSARAKARSLSSPRLRPINIETWSASNSPYKQKMLSPISSINSDASCSGRIWNGSGARGGFGQRSPSLKGVLKSSKSSKNLSFGSECAMPNWDEVSQFK